MLEMGLAFDLEASDIGGQMDWFQHFMVAKQTIEDTSAGHPLGARWDNIEFMDPTEFDIRIRKVFDMNGVNVIVGSYRGEFTLNPHGIAGFQYAWDGFIAINRSFKWVNPLEQNYQTWVDKAEYNPFIGPIQLGTWQILPMRMPYEWCPGGTAAQIAADDTVGLYGVDGGKSFDNLLSGDYGEIGNNFSQLVVCGFGRIDGGVEGALSDQDYVGALYTIPLDWNVYLNNVAGGSTTNEYGAVYATNKAFHQLTWKANEANHVDNTDAAARFTARDLNTYLVDNSVYAPIPWNDTPDVAGQLVDAQGYYPRRFLDVATVLFIPGWDIATEQTAGPVIIAGDCVKDDGAGAVEYSAPLAVGGIPFAAPDGSEPNPLFVLSARTDQNIIVEDLGVPYNLEGAWFSHVMPASDFILTSGGAGSTNLPPILFAAENVLHGVSRKAEIYAMTGSDDSAESAWMLGQYPYRGGATPQTGDKSIGPFAVSGGTWETATGFTLPDRWLNRFQQMRTFTKEEENIAKSTLTGEGEFYNAAWQPTDSQGVRVGTVGNQPRFGAPNKTAQEAITPGVASSISGGFLGYSGSAGSRTAFALVFDVGSLSFTTTDLVAPFTFNSTGAFTSQASTILDILDTPDADAVIMSADWDNDRDQWLFVIGRSTVGIMGVVSAASDFTQFIDQTDNLKILTPGTPPPAYQILDSGLYKSRLMTNELDGLIIGGTETDLAGPGITLAPITITDVPYYNEIYVKGTTGRTCRVWIDYVLYDGSEGLIAVKLANLGLRVNPENVEWFKARILNNLGVDQLDMKTEEIESWMEAQSKQYKDMMRTKERSGRLRRRKSQVSSYLSGIDGAILDAHGLAIDNSGEPQGINPDDIEGLLKDMDPSKLPPDVDES